MEAVRNLALCCNNGQNDSPRKAIQHRSPSGQVGSLSLGLRLGYENRGRDSSTAFQNVDRTPIPKSAVGHYLHFCPPDRWSSAFAAQGEYTIKAAGFEVRGGKKLYKFALLCCWVKDLQTCEILKLAAPNILNSSFVEFIYRSDEDFKSLAEKMTLKLPGLELLKRLPSRSLFGSISSIDNSTSYVRFLSDLLTTTHYGHNLLIPVEDNISKDVDIRNFLGMPSWSVVEAGSADSNSGSCNGRIESETKRMGIPSEWRTAEPTSTKIFLDDLAEGRKKSRSLSTTPNSSPVSNNKAATVVGITSLSLVSSRSSENLARPSVTIPPLKFEVRSSSSATRNDLLSPLDENLPTSIGGSPSSSLAPLCTNFVSPRHWKQLNSQVVKNAQLSFTVEISRIAIVDSHAEYTISILFRRYSRSGSRKNPKPQLIETDEIYSVTRRYSEFYEFSKVVMERIPLDQRRLIKHHLPAKAYPRDLSPAFLEARSGKLQKWLENILILKLKGLVVEDMPTSALPSVRQFLGLPDVQWTLLPRHRGTRRPSSPHESSPPSPENRATRSSSEESKSRIPVRTSRLHSSNSSEHIPIDRHSLTELSQLTHPNGSSNSGRKILTSSQSETALLKQSRPSSS